MTTVTTIIKYEIGIGSGIRTRPTFDYEFPQKLYAIVKD